MATKKNQTSETNPSGSDPAGLYPGAEIAKPVTRKKRSTVQKVADAVSDTVKEIADKVTGKTSGSKVRKPVATVSKESSVTKTPDRKKASAETDVDTKPKTKTVAQSKTPTKPTKVGALSAGVTSGDVRDSLNDLSNSGSLRIENEAATDVKEHFFQDQNANPAPPPPQPSRDVPDEYGDTKLVLMIRDPEYVYAYWEISDETRKAMEIPRDGDSRRYVLRLYKVSGRQWPEEAAHYFFDVDVSADAKSWYVQLPEPDELWCAELGIIDARDDYKMVCRSNPVSTPRNSISEDVDNEWMTVAESFEKITRLSGAGGDDAHMEQFLRGEINTNSESIIRHVHRQLTGVFPGERVALSSGIFSSETAMRHKDFWLQVHTELILYGATEPDAKVTVQGRPVTLNADGTFSMRFALPDGEQILEVRARNADDDMEESVTPVVVRSTR